MTTKSAEIWYTFNLTLGHKSPKKFAESVHRWPRKHNFFTKPSFKNPTLGSDTRERENSHLKVMHSPTRTNLLSLSKNIKTVTKSDKHCTCEERDRQSCPARPFIAHVQGWDLLTHACPCMTHIMSAPMITIACWQRGLEIRGGRIWPPPTPSFLYPLLYVIFPLFSALSPLCN